MPRSFRSVRLVVVLAVVGLAGLGVTGCVADPPPRMSATVAGDGQVTVSWQQPLAVPFPVVAYEVTPWIQHVKQTPVRFDSTATTQIVKGLRNFTPYMFTVKAINALGNDSASSASSDPVTPTGAPSPVTFASLVPFPRTGDGLAVGDVNDDGVPDMVFGGVSVRLGLGDATFGAPIDAPAGGGQPVLVDVNGDGLVDVVTIYGDTDEVSVLRGDGTGHFGAEVRYATGANPWRLTVADLNGDDVVDLVTASASANSVSVLLGNGDGTFAPHHDYSTPGPRDVAISDFNSDEIPDLAAANEIMLGNGDGTFGTVIPLDVSGFVSAAGDLNNDGHADLVLQAGNLRVLLGHGDGTFDLAGVFDTVGCECPLKLADINGDGIVDVAVGGNGGAPSAVSVLVGNGDGTLALHTDFDVGVFGDVEVSDIEVSDLNGDGLPDLTAAAYNIPDVGEATSTASVLLNRPGLPLAPSVGGAQGNDHAATVSWTAPPTNDTYPITGYIVTPQIWHTNTTVPPTTYTSTATTETVTGLTNGTRYVFWVQAINAVGVGQYSGPTPGTFGTLVGKLPNPPTIGPATPGDTTATVTWTAPAPVGSAVSGYTVTPYVGAVAAAPTTFNSTTTTQTVTGLTNGTTYTFTVAAINGVGTGPESQQSNPVTPTP